MPVEVLLIEDNPREARLVQEIVARGPVPIRITTAYDCSGALARLSDVQIRPHLVIADMGVLEFCGVELLRRCNPTWYPGRRVQWISEPQASRGYTPARSEGIRREADHARRVHRRAAEDDREVGGTRIVARGHDHPGGMKSYQTIGVIP